MSATAQCLGCGWTAGPVTAADADRQAAKHTRKGHPTITCAEPTRRTA